MVEFRGTQSFGQVTAGGRETRRQARRRLPLLLVNQLIRVQTFTAGDKDAAAGPPEDEAAAAEAELAAAGGGVAGGSGRELM